MVKSTRERLDMRYMLVCGSERDEMKVRPELMLIALSVLPRLLW